MIKNNYSILDDNGFNKVRLLIYNIVYINKFDKHFLLKIFCWIYNIIVHSFFIVGLIPIFISFFSDIDTHYNITISYVYFFIMIGSTVYILDYLLRLMLSDIIYNEKNKLKSLRRYLLNIFYTYQLVSSVTLLFLLFFLSTTKGNIIYFDKNPNFNDDKAIIIFSIFFSFNFIIIYPNFISRHYDKDNKKIVSLIIIPKIKIIIIAILFLLIILTSFSFIILILEQNYYSLNPDVSGNKIDTMFKSFWFSFITITTIGYGDYVPFSIEGKYVSLALSIIGVAYYGFLCGLIVNIYTDFISRKKNILSAIQKEKAQEYELTKLINNINNKIISSLTELKIIDTDKYNNLIGNNDTKVYVNNFNKNFSRDVRTKKIIMNNQLLGVINNNSSEINEAENKRWIFFDEKIPEIDKAYGVVYYFSRDALKKIIHTSKFSVIFTNLLDSNYSISKVMPFYKANYKKIPCEFSVYANVVCKKEIAWEKLGENSCLTKKEFNRMFVNQEKVNVLFIKDIILYQHEKILESYAIYDYSKKGKVFYIKEF